MSSDDLKLFVHTHQTLYTERADYDNTIITYLIVS